MADSFYAPFGELFETPLRNGLTKPKAVRGEGTKMVNMGEVFAHRRIYNLDMDRVPLDNKERDSSLLRAGDLLFARQSLVLSGAGKCVLFQGDTEDVTFESHIIRCRLDRQKAEPAFYFYLFQSSLGRSLIESIVEQVAAAGIRGSDLRRLEVPVPPLAEQKAIAAVLGALDDKIELNRRMNATLEAMARALFQSWFVDFDPVRAKLDGRQPPNLDLATAALFPDAFQDSEAGRIPNGWDVRTLAVAFDIKDGSTFKKEDRLEKGQIIAFGANGPIGFSARENVNEPCIILGKIGSCGSLHRSWRHCWVTNNAFIVKPHGGGSLEFVWQTLCAIDFGPFIGGSANPYMPLKNFGHKRVVMPPVALLCAYQERVNDLAQKILANNDESRTLATLRDALLPKLIGGELKLSENRDAIINLL